MQLAITKIISPYKELLFWVASLLALYFIYPVSEGDFSFCVYKMVGIENCWGCGIGKSMSCAMHGQIEESFHFHWMGVFALVIIAMRLFSLVYKNLIKSNYE